MATVFLERLQTKKPRSEASGLILGGRIQYGVNWLDGMICFAWLELDHDNWATAPPVFWKYCIWMVYFWPAVSAIVPLSCLELPNENDLN